MPITKPEERDHIIAVLWDTIERHADMTERDWAQLARRLGRGPDPPAPQQHEQR